MIKKLPIYPLRIRRVPSQFSWVDHRLVRDRHIESCSHPAAALYLFLVTVADQEGLSYYSDASLMSRLGMDVQTLHAARQNLIRTKLVAYEDPLYQVLSLDPCNESKPDPRNARPGPTQDAAVSIGRLFKQMLGETS
ncbi:MAG: hypothetical protein P4L43_02615 [Syntrophobacteraceae bacterium]|nr:hypothetical protein [Syntrophobacteraceae bacterium]